MFSCSISNGNWGSLLNFIRGAVLFVLKKVVASFVFLILLFGVLEVSANEKSDYYPCNTSLLIDNQQVVTDSKFLMQNYCMLVPLHTVEFLGATYEWNPDEWKIRIQTESRKLTMYLANYNCANDAKVEKMPAQPTLYNDNVMIPLRYVAEALGATVAWSGKTDSVFVSTTGEIPEDFYGTNEEEETVAEEEPVEKDETVEVLRNRIIVLDPGHGGSDPGAVAGNIKEKDLNLQVAKILNVMLQKAGAAVYMTRTEDKYVGLYTRADIANNLNADLFVSIHHNASPNSGAKGVMTLYYPTAKKTKMNGQKFAEIVQKNLVNDLNAKDWGIIPRPNLVVTRETKMPAVLAELGFMTNKSELERMVTYEFQYQAAKSLFNSIIEALQ